MGSDIELISDGEGLAVIGDPAAVERFLISEGLQSKDLGLSRLSRGLGAGAVVAQVGSQIAVNSGQWVKLTKESAHLLNKYPLMKGSSPGVSRAILTDGGRIKNVVEFTAGSLANPALLAGAAGIMAQLAMQQAMDEITDYLAVIDAKLDDVLRAQKDAVVADMIGVEFVITEAMTIRGQVGRVSEVTWSKVHGTAVTIARTQAYTLRQLDALAGKLERTTSIGDLADASREAESKVHEWLSVLARCFQLQDAIAVLEIDRVLDTSPVEMDQHRIALAAARRNRLELIARSTERLMARMDEAASKANTKVLLHPIDSRAVVVSSNQVATGVTAFHGLLGLDRTRESLEAKRWVEAFTDAKDDVLETGAGGVEAAKRIGGETIGKARSMTDKIALKLAERALLRREESERDGGTTELP